MSRQFSKPSHGQSGWDSPLNAALDNVDARLLHVAFDVTDYGAVGDGSTDDATAFSAALTAARAATGGTVLVPGGATYMLGSTLDVSGCAIVGSGERLYPILKVKSGFSGSSVLHVPDGVSVNNRGSIANLTIDGNSIGSSIAGVLIEGKTADVELRHVGVQNMSGHGFSVGVVGSNKPLTVNGLGLHADNNAGDGFHLATGNDSAWVDCYALGNLGYGWYIADSGNSRWIGCRAEWSGLSGWYITGSWFTGSGANPGAGVWSGCSTDRNNNHGVLMDCTGAAAMLLTGFMLRRDGRNSGSGGGNYAGLAISSVTNPVTVVGVTCVPGKDDDLTGTASPQIGVTVSGSTAVQVISGYVHGATTAVTDGGSNTSFVVSQVGQATGATTSPTRVNANLDVAGRSLGITTPRDLNMIAWNFDPISIRANVVPSKGSIYVAAIFVPRVCTVSNILWDLEVNGGTLTAAQNWVGLFNTSGTLLTSTDITTAAGSGAVKLVTTAITPQALTPGWVWVGWVFNGTTAPGLGVGGATGAATIANAGLALASSRFAQATAAASSTTLASFTPASMTGQSANTFWAALS